MATWRKKNKKVKEVTELTLTELNADVNLEVGDMVEILSGEFPYRSITQGMNWTMHANGNRFSVVHSEYLKREYDYVNRCLLMPLDGSNQELGLIQMSYDPYMRAKVRIFPVDSVDSW